MLRYVRIRKNKNKIRTSFQQKQTFFLCSKVQRICGYHWEILWDNSDNAEHYQDSFCTKPEMNSQPVTIQVWPELSRWVVSVVLSLVFSRTALSVETQLSVRNSLRFISQVTSGQTLWDNMSRWQQRMYSYSYKLFIANIRQILIRMVKFLFWLVWYNWEWFISCSYSDRSWTWEHLYQGQYSCGQVPCIQSNAWGSLGK